MTGQRTPAGNIVAVVSDVDGTLVRPDKTLAPRTIEAVEELRRAGIWFAIVSSRPPRGMTSVIDRLAITAPIAGFNGGVVASPTSRPGRPIPARRVAGIPGHPPTPTRSPLRAAAPDFGGVMVRVQR